MGAIIETVIYVVGGGFLILLGLESSFPGLTTKKMIAWAAFILIGAPILLILFAALIGINV